MNFDSIKSYFYGSMPLIKLIQKSFWKSFFGPFFAFGFPLIFIGILGTILGYDQVLGGSFAISPIAITLSSMPSLIFEFKNSSLLKRIGSTPIKPSLFIFISIIFYFGIIILSIIWCLIFSLMIFGIPYWDDGRVITEFKDPSSGKILETKAASFSDTLANVHWAGFIFGQLTIIMVGLTLGVVIVSISKSSMTTQGLGVIILISSQFLCAMVLPLATVKGVDAMWVMGYILSPFKASTNVILESWNGSVEFVQTSTVPVPHLSQSNIFDLEKDYYFYDTNSIDLAQVLILDKTEKIVSLLLPFCWVVIFLGISIKFFKWSTR